MLPLIPLSSELIECSIIPNCFNKDQLNSLNSLLENLPYKNAQLGENNKEDNNIRKSEIKWIPQTSNYFWLYKKIEELVNYSNKAYWNFDLTFMEESIQYTEYRSSNEGHFDWHLDMGNGIFSRRKTSITIQLSDSSEYEGGDLEFNLGKGNIFKVPKEKNTAIIFPSYLLHRVTPITKGIRKSLVLWVGGAPFR